MTKFCGKIGFIKTEEVEPGVWDKISIEKTYRGDLIRNIHKSEVTSDSVNNNINLSNNISIVADNYLNENFQYMKYVVFNGAKWNIADIEIQYPRLILTVRGLYNG